LTIFSSSPTWEQERKFFHILTVRERPHIFRLQAFPLKGFTLIEVVLSLGLCSFALISLISLLPVSLKAAKKSVEIARTAKLTQQMVAELSQSRFTNLVALSGAVIERTYDYDGNPTTNSNSVHFTLTARIHGTTTLPGAADTSSSLARVEIEVKTPDRTSPNRIAIVLSDLGY